MLKSKVQSKVQSRGLCGDTHAATSCPLLLRPRLMSKPMLVTWPFVMLLLITGRCVALNPQPSTLNLDYSAVVTEKIPFFAWRW